MACGCGWCDHVDTEVTLGIAAFPCDLPAIPSGRRGSRGSGAEGRGRGRPMYGATSRGASAERSLHDQRH